MQGMQGVQGVQGMQGTAGASCAGDVLNCPSPPCENAAAHVFCSDFCQDRCRNYHFVNGGGDDAFKAMTIKEREAGKAPRHRLARWKLQLDRMGKRSQKPS